MEPGGHQQQEACRRNQRFDLLAAGGEGSWWREVRALVSGGVSRAVGSEILVPSTIPRISSAIFFSSESIRIPRSARGLPSSGRIWSFASQETFCQAQSLTITG